MSNAASAPPRVVITGVARGIGRATALAYAKLGGCVAGLHRDPDPAVSAALSDAISAAGGEAMIRVGDTAARPRSMRWPTKPSLRGAASMCGLTRRPACWCSRSSI